MDKKSGFQPRLADSGKPLQLYRWIIGHYDNRRLTCAATRLGKVARFANSCDISKNFAI